MTALIQDIQASLPPTDARTRVSQLMKSIQDEICTGLQAVDGVSQFKEDSWEREEGVAVVPAFSQREAFLSKQV